MKLTLLIRIYYDQGIYSYGIDMSKDLKKIHMQIREKNK